jgi:hypothetical protein
MIPHTIRSTCLTAAATAALALGGPAGAAAPDAAGERYAKFSGREAPSRSAAQSAGVNQISQAQSGRMAGSGAAGPPGIASRWIKLESWSLEGSAAATADALAQGPGRLTLAGAFANCRPGDRYKTLELREGRDGPVTTLADVQVAACDARSVAVSFAGVGG